MKHSGRPVIPTRKIRWSEKTYFIDTGYDNSINIICTENRQYMEGKTKY